MADGNRDGMVTLAELQAVIDARREAIIVHDGRGLPPDKELRMFQRFQRLEDTLKRGTGLSLVIVKDFAKRWN